MMTSQILKTVSFTKTRKPWYLRNETLFSLQIKKFAAEVAFNCWNFPILYRIFFENPENKPAIDNLKCRSLFLSDTVMA